MGIYLQHTCSDFVSFDTFFTAAVTRKAGCATHSPALIVAAWLDTWPATNTPQREQWQQQFVRPPPEENERSGARTFSTVAVHARRIELRRTDTCTSWSAASNHTHPARKSS
jgi:hypothetical protein